MFHAASASAAISLALGFGPVLFAEPAPDVISTCVSKNGDIRTVAGGGPCKQNETPLTWNVDGPAGPAGPPGAIGPAGPAGPAGKDGRDGRDGDANVPPPPTVHAQMRIAGLNGGNPTPIVSFSLGAANTASAPGGSGGGAGKVSFSNLVVSKLLDGDSVPLLQAAATGQVLASVVIDVFAIGSQAPFATYTFADVTVTSTVLGSSTSTVNEQDAFDFRRITSDVTINGQSFHSCFDIKTLTPCS